MTESGICKWKALSSKKIDHTYGTEDDEKIWLVRTNDGVKRKIPKNIINRYNMLVDQTTWTIRKTGPMIRVIPGKFKKRRLSEHDKRKYEKICVFWNGFKTCTFEHRDFKYTGNEEEF